MKTDQLLKGPAVSRGLSLPKGLNDALVERSRQEDRSASRIIKRALLLYLSQPQSSKDQQQAREVAGES